MSQEMTNLRSMMTPITAAALMKGEPSLESETRKAAPHHVHLHFKDNSVWGELPRGSARHLELSFEFSGNYILNLYF